MDELNIFELVLEYIDVIYIVICNIITYLLISFIQNMKTKKIPTSIKRAISAVVGISMGCVVILGFHHSLETVFYSFFIQFLTWDYFFKWLSKKFNKKRNKANIE
jgi:hypothetical protein